MFKCLNNGEKNGVGKDRSLSLQHIPASNSPLLLRSSVNHELMA